MAKTLLNVKTDDSVKKQAQEIARELGIPLSTVVNAYLKEFIRERSVRFALEPQLRPEIYALLKKASKDLTQKKNTTKTFTSAKQALDYLHS